jgi:ferredoxin
MYSKVLSLRFPKEIVEQPIAVNLVRKFDLTFNILKATISPKKEGLMVIQLTGHRKNFKRGLRYLRSLGIKVESIAQDVKRNDNKCIQCGCCTAVCPTGALHIKRPEMEVLFDSSKCSACEMCVSVCPVHAMIVRFDRNLLS